MPVARHWRSFYFAAALSAAWAPVFCDTVIEPDGLTVLSNGADLCHDPVIASQGGVTVAAWTALSEGRKRIFAAEFSGGWSTATPADDSDDGDCTGAVARFSPAGDISLVWTRENGGEYSLNFRQPGAPSELIAASLLRMETPSLCFDSEERPIVAWSEGEGGKFAVIVARRVDGGWSRTVLSEGLGAYDILPTAIGGAAPSVYWYSLGNQDFRLTAANWNGVDWSLGATGLLGTLPANRLPYLYDTQTSLGPGAVWVEPLSGGELVLTADPRFGLEQFVQPLPGSSQARQLEPDAASDASQPAFAWREETAAGSDIVVLRGDALARVTGIAHMTQPRLAITVDGSIHLLFVSDQIEGGTGQVYTAILD